jgi:PDZ domain-containing protein
VVSSVVVAAGLAAGLVRIPYDTIGPGEVRVVNNVVTVHGHEVYPPAGRLLETTVSVRERVSVLQAILGWLDPTTDVVSEKDIRGNIPPEQYRQINVEAMNDSKTSAELLALQHLGYTGLAAGARVDSVAPKTPADGVLKANDVIVAIDGKPVKTPDDAVALIRAHQPGDALSLQVARGNAPPTDVQATLTRADDGHALLGVQLTTSVRLPFDVSIDSGDVVGPSAGLAYGLELLDLLTAGELTGGTRVAATGELAANGDVEAIGGVRQKVITVERAGAKVFLVPKANEAEARAHAPKGLQIIGVGTFDEALRALGSIPGSNALTVATPPPRT